MKCSASFTASFLRTTLLVLSLLTVNVAVAQSSGDDTAYWCKHSNGAEYAQREPCEPGMEVRRGRLVPGGNGLIESEPVAVAPINTGAASRKPVAETPVAKAVEKASEKTDRKTDPKTNTDPLHEGQMSLLKLLGFALVFGIVAKVMGRSFWAGFIGGAVLRIVLVAMNVMKF